MNAVDTNVFVYALDANDPVRQARAHDLLDRLIQTPSDTVLLWQVAAELLSCLRKWESANQISSEDVEAHFRDVLAMFALRLPGVTVFDASFELRSRYSLSHWDSLLLAACKDAGVDTLFSEDMTAGIDYDGITIVNPFV
jgi:predicted nucleic acid-binding protein